jgi:hypothetical protein
MYGLFVLHMLPASVHCTNANSITGGTINLKTHHSGQLKFKARPVTCHEGTEEEYMYSPTLSLTSALDGVGG